MSKHTEGPWFQGTDPRQIESGNGTIIAVVSGAASNESTIADARLISAAPELLDLALMLVELDRLISRHDILGGLGNLLEHAHKAVEQATGEQQ